MYIKLFQSFMNIKLFQSFMNIQLLHFAKVYFSPDESERLLMKTCNWLGGKRLIVYPRIQGVLAVLRYTSF